MLLVNMVAACLSLRLYSSQDYTVIADALLNSMCNATVE